MKITARTQSDEQFLNDCQIETYRGPGPGGQKRNKTSSAVRITHVPSGLNAIAGESRSQSTNKGVAVRRVRLRMAIEQREHIDLERFELPNWFTLTISDRNPLYPQVVGLVLDVLSAADWATSTARDVLKASSRPFIQFLHNEPELWATVQRERKQRGMRELKGNDA
jgi:hypothetical protein